MVKASTLLICLGTLISITATRWSQVPYRKSISQIYHDAKAGKIQSTPYQKVAVRVSTALLVVGVYLALTLR